jgi:hypothetical protein
MTPEPPPRGILPAIPASLVLFAAGMVYVIHHL